MVAWLDRRQALSRLASALDAQPPGTVLGVLSVGIDRLRLINDSVGHAVGDEVIASVGSRLREITGRNDLVARLNGGEFLVGVFREDREHTEGQAQRIVDGFRRPVIAGDRPIQLAVSVGVTTTEAGSAAVPLTLVQQAGMARHLARSRGGNRQARFTTELSHQADRRFDLEQALACCLEHDELSLHYQAVCGVADRNIVGAETLLRWRRRTSESVSPDEFVPILEETGQIVAVGAWVLRTALRQLGIWKRDGSVSAEFNLAINVSPVQLSDPGLVGLVRRALQRDGVFPRDVTLEITETAALSTQVELATLGELSELGVGLSLDDFATGHSSLAMLETLPVTQLKIDKQFVTSMLRGAHQGVLIATLIDLAHRARITCVAEGVETPEQLARLHELGCDFAQGFLLGRPVTAREFVDAYR